MNDICAAALAIAMLSGPAAAMSTGFDTLTGDEVFAEVFLGSPAPGISVTDIGIAGPGNDLGFVESNGQDLLLMDFDAGPDRNEFVMSLLFSTSANEALGFSRVILSNLDFPMSHVLSGFDVLEDRLSGTTISIDTVGGEVMLNVEFNGNTGAAPVAGGQPLLRGRFVTSAVPTPGALGLLATGLAAFGVFRLRRRSQAG